MTTVNPLTLLSSDKHGGGRAIGAYFPVPSFVGKVHSRDVLAQKHNRVDEGPASARLQNRHKVRQSTTNSIRRVEGRRGRP